MLTQISRCCYLLVPRITKATAMVRSFFLATALVRSFLEVLKQTNQTNYIQLYLPIWMKHPVHISSGSTLQSEWCSPRQNPALLMHWVSVQQGKACLFRCGAPEKDSIPHFHMAVAPPDTTDPYQQPPPPTTGRFLQLNLQYRNTCPALSLYTQ